MLVTALLVLLATPASPTVSAAPVSPIRCRIAAGRMAQWVLLGQGMVENLERRGVPPHRKQAYDAMVETLAVDEPLVTRLLERLERTRPTAADDAAFGSPNPQQMRKLLQDCDADPAITGPPSR